MDAKFLHADNEKDLDPVVQSIVSLTSSLVVKCYRKYNIKFTGIFAEKM